MLKTRTVTLLKWALGIFIRMQTLFLALVLLTFVQVIMRLIVLGDRRKKEKG